MLLCLAAFVGGACDRTSDRNENTGGLATPGGTATEVPTPQLEPGDWPASSSPVPTPDAPAEVPVDVEPTPEPTPAPIDIRAIICSVPWPCAEALLVVYGPTPANDRAPDGCPNGESGGRPGVFSRGGHRGLFQLYDGHIWRFERRGWTWDDAFDPAKNVAIAHELWLERGWQPWSCRP